MHSCLCTWYYSALVALIFFACSARAHTWVEQLTVINPNGTFVGTPGFARGNVLRTAPNFGDPLMVHILPPDGRPATEGILNSDLMCRDSQTKPVQTDGSPRLQAPAGSLIALRYQENGHVTMPQNQPGKPSNRGNVFIYGTTQPSESDTFLAIHNQWNAAGTGGDKRGKLLATQPFDDGQCYQVNAGDISVKRKAEFPHETTQLTGSDLWCQNDIAIPSDAPNGKPYTLYWVWDWPTAPNVDPGLPKGKTEIYTTCMDVDITDKAETKDLGGTSKQQNINVKAGVDGSINNIAIPKYMQELTQGSQPSLPETVPQSESSQGSKGSKTAQPTVAQAQESNIPRNNQSTTAPAISASPNLPTETKVPQLPTVKPLLVPLAPVTVTVTEKPTQQSITVTVTASSAGTTIPVVPASAAKESKVSSAVSPELASEESRVSSTAVLPTSSPALSADQASPQPTTLVALANTFTGTASALSVALPSNSSTAPSPSRVPRCNDCKLHKRSRIFGSAGHKHRL